MSLGSLGRLTVTGDPVTDRDFTFTLDQGSSVDATSVRQLVEEVKNSGKTLMTSMATYAPDVSYPGSDTLADVDGLCRAEGHVPESHGSAGARGKIRACRNDTGSPVLGVAATSPPARSARVSVVSWARP